MSHRPQLHLLSALITAAALLSACGGGGGGGDGPGASSVSSGSGGTSTPAAGSRVQIQADTQAVANGDYGVAAAGAAPVTVTLPASSSLAVGDTVRVTGVSGAWQIGQNADQTVLTPTLGGNTAPGVNWVASTLPATPWHWVASSLNGQVLAAADIPGTLHISTDGGTTWRAGSGLPRANWIGVDMTPDGQRMVAVAFEGGMYRSSDRGATWTAVTSPAAEFNGRDWEAVTISDDGQRIAAVILNGPLVTSTDGGTTWTVATAGGAPLVLPWRHVDSSADGTTLVAVTQFTAGTPAASGEVYLSRDAGATWTAVPVAAGIQGWYRARISRDGSVIAVATNAIYAGGGDGLFLSRDRGSTWSAAGPDGDYTGIALSEDGKVVGVTLSNGSSGSVQYSSDAGLTFAPLAVPSGGDTNFRHIAMDRYGYKLAVVTGTFIVRPGQLYTSLGNRTSSGTGGAITGGGPGESVQLRYEGGGTFRVVGSTGEFAAR